MKVCVRCSEVYDDPLERCPADGEPLVSATDPLIGRTVGGRYRLISRIGAGGMSSVYLARHVLIDRLVAVKSLRRDLAQDPKQRDRFIREARAVNRINHDNIVEITDFGETEDGIVYLVMEYVPGEPLFKAMARGPFPAMRALHIAEQIGSALGRAHQMGVVHRDLKPENLLVVPRKGRPDFIKILDFGIAKILDAPSLTGSQQIFGTPGYIAPEYIQSTAIDGRADLYSLGVILYELVTGALPFDYEYPGDLLVKHVTEAPIPPRKRRAEVEVPVEELILRCLEKNPDRRFRDAYHFLDELRAARERLGCDDSWGGLSEPRVAPEAGRSGPSTPTPVVSIGSRDDLLRHTVRDEGPPEAALEAALRDAADANLGDTQRDAPVLRPDLAPEDPASADGLRIPRPPPPARAALVRGAPMGGATPPRAGTPADGLASHRRWRRRFDALRAALDDIELADTAPTHVAHEMAFCSQRMDELEQRAAIAARNQQDLEDLEAQGRDYRASLGAATDELAFKLSALHGELDTLGERRADLVARGAAQPEIDAVDEALRVGERKRRAVEAQLTDLREQLEEQSAGHEVRLSALARACDEEMAGLDALAASLRAPLEAVERYVRTWWDARSGDARPRR